MGFKRVYAFCKKGRYKSIKVFLSYLRPLLQAITGNSNKPESHIRALVFWASKSFFLLYALLLAARSKMRRWP